MWVCKYCLTTNPDWRERQCGNPDCGISRNLAEATLDDDTLCVIGLIVKGLSYREIARELGFPSGDDIMDVLVKAMDELNVEAFWEVVPTAHQTLDLLRVEGFKKE